MILCVWIQNFVFNRWRIYFFSINGIFIKFDYVLGYKGNLLDFEELFYKDYSFDYSVIKLKNNKKQ